MAFKIYLGRPSVTTHSTAPAGHLGLFFSTTGNTLQLHLTSNRNHLLKFIVDSELATATFQISEFVCCRHLPTDSRDSVLCRGSGGEWEFTPKNRPIKLSEDKVTALQKYLKEVNLCLS